MKKVTILIPVFNEFNTLKEILEKVENAKFCNLEKEIILIDDASTDGTLEILAELKDKYKVFYHKKNMGKGAALKTGLKEATGDIIVIQDADLEYNPADYDPLIQIILDEKADVVYGSRLMKEDSLHTFMPSHLFGNRLITFVTNLLYGAKLTDMETCYKAFKKEFIENIDIKSLRFDFEPEITAKVLKKKARLKEYPISYDARLHNEGKKITWIDGFHAIWALAKFRFID